MSRRERIPLVQRQRGLLRQPDPSHHGLIDELYYLGVLTLNLAGGEPFVRRDLIAVLEHACSLPGWTITVITNGTFLTDARIEQLLERCPGLTVNVGIDGSTPDRFGLLRHQRHTSPARQAALFEKVVGGIRRAVSAGLLVKLNFTLARATCDDLRATYQLGVDGLGAAGIPRLAAIAPTNAPSLGRDDQTASRASGSRTAELRAPPLVFLRGQHGQLTA